MVGGLVDPDTKKHNVGGVGCKIKGDDRIIKLKPKTKQLRAACILGRVDLYYIEIGAGHNVYIYNPYGYTGGHGNRNQALKTSALISAIRAEAKAQPPGPVGLRGDLNTDLVDIDEVRNLILDHGWIDVGGRARQWQQPDNEYACLTGNAKLPTRRGYLIVNSEMHPLVTNFQVIHSDTYPTHSTLRFRLSRTNVIHHKNILHEQQHEDLLGDDSSSNHIRQFAWDQSMVRLRTVIDEALNSKARAFGDAAKKQDSNRFWRMWHEGFGQAVFQCIDADKSEEGSIHAGGQSHDDYAHFRGHGRVTIKLHEVHGTPTIDRKVGEVRQLDYSHYTHQLAKQATRCSQWADRICVERRGHLTDEQKNVFHKLNQDARNTIFEYLDDSDTTPRGLKHAIHNNTWRTTLCFPATLRLAAKHDNMLHSKQQEEDNSKVAHSRKAELAQNKSLRQAYAKLTANIVPPLQYTTVSETIDGQQYTNLVTNPMDADAIVTKAWSKFEVDSFTNRSKSQPTTSPSTFPTYTKRHKSSWTGSRGNWSTSFSKLYLRLLEAWMVFGLWTCDFYHHMPVSSLHRC